MKELHKKAAIIVYKMQFSPKKLHRVWMAKALEAAQVTGLDNVFSILLALGPFIGPVEGRR